MTTSAQRAAAVKTVAAKGKCFALIILNLFHQICVEMHKNVQPTNIYLIGFHWQI